MAYMRLLHRKSNGEIVFREPTNHHVPAYAILSHTWGTEEVTFDDVLWGSDRKKKGWAKIQFCAQQAAIDGLQYFWVDTCCIDKRNAVELSAALNSMFRWYQDSARCYVYLADVARPPEVEDIGGLWKAQFMSSRWFSRGWTLQELIAPSHVKFFSREESLLGFKTTLEYEIHEITNIPMVALGRSRLSEFGVDERMSWATRRQTTVEEDQVYCLLGLVEVFIPPIYGEGKDSALWRLKDALRRNPAPRSSRGRDNDGEQDQSSNKSGSSAVVPTSPYGRFQSLDSIWPVLQIPTKQIGDLFEKLSPNQHQQIANVIVDNCKRAAAGLYLDQAQTNQNVFRAIEKALGHKKVHNTLDTIDLEFWLRVIPQAIPRPQEDVEKDGPTQDLRYSLRNCHDILKIQDSRGRLSPLQFENSLCSAISWCRLLHNPEGEVRLGELWNELHPTTTYNRNWGSLDFNRLRVPRGSFPQTPWGVFSLENCGACTPNTTR